MDHQTLKEYARLNLQRSGLTLSEQDAARAADHADAMQKVITANLSYDAFHYEVKENRFERFWFGSMSLTCWALVCLATLLFPLIVYFQNGTPTIVFTHSWGLYILPALVLVVRFFLNSFINIAHGVLLLACAALTILKIRIFGSEINWMWVFLVVGTLLTLGGRLWEATHSMKGNKQWYRERSAVLTDANAAMPEALSAYAAVGAGAEAELRRLAPHAKRPERTPWFLPPKGRRGKDKQLQLPEAQNALSDFYTLKKDRVEPFSTHKYFLHGEVEKSGDRHIRVYDQELGTCTVPPDDAAKYIQEKGLLPFYGMAVPELAEGLTCTVLRHRWSEHIHEVGVAIYKTHIEVTTNARSKKRSEIESEEIRVLGKLAGAYTPTTTADTMRYYDYMDKKEKILNSLSDTELETTVEHSSIDEEYEKHYEEIGALYVTTPDGQVVGLYCTDTDQSIACARSFAAQFWNAGLSAWVVPGSEAQRGFLYRACFM